MGPVRPARSGPAETPSSIKPSEVSPTKLLLEAPFRADVSDSYAGGAVGHKAHVALRAGPRATWRNIPLPATCIRRTLAYLISVY